jgi:hypothetical protein
MVSSISGSSTAGINPQIQSAMPGAATHAEPTAPLSTATPAPQKDTVELTGAALARSLKQQGQTVAQIALKMGLDAKTVVSYLGTAAPKQVSTPAPQAVTTAPKDASAAKK